MDTKLTNPTPKQRFQDNKVLVSALNELLQDDSFHAACDLALLEYQRTLASLPGLENPQMMQVVAMANGYRIQGAMEFLSELRNIGNKKVVAMTPGIERVNHAAQ